MTNFTRQDDWSRPSRMRCAGFVGSSLLVLAAMPALGFTDSQTSVGKMVYDAAIERPLGIAETAFGVGITTVAYPLSIGSGNSSLVVDRCITKPGQYTFTRALGDFSSRPSNECSPVGFGWGLVRFSFGLVERPLGFIFGRSPFSRERTTPGSSDELEVDGPSAPDRRTTEIEI